jgi:hypothetical protein
MARETGTVRFKFGGIEHRCSVPLALAVEIEEATGVGVISLGIAFAGNGGQVRHALEIIRLCLNRNGKDYSSKDVLEMASYEGLATAASSAARIVNALFVIPKPGKVDAGSTEGPAPPTIQ